MEMMGEITLKDSVTREIVIKDKYIITFSDMGIDKNNIENQMLTFDCPSYMELDPEKEFILEIHAYSSANNSIVQYFGTINEPSLSIDKQGSIWSYIFSYKSRNVRQKSNV